MTFTYTGTLATDLDFIRFKIGDRTASSGPLPGTGTATNFTDEEINGLLSEEGTKERTVAALYEMLGAAWARYVDSKIGPRDEKLSQVSARYFALAKQWRDDYGSSGSDLFVGYLNEGLNEPEET